MRSALVFVLLVAFTRGAAADAEDDTPKSPDGALLLSAGSTAIGLGAIGVLVLTGHTEGGGGTRAAWTFAATAAFIGPSVGHLYVDPKNVMTPGFAIRFGTIPVAMIAGLTYGTSDCEDEGDPCKKGKYVLYGAATAIVAGAVLDFVTVRAAARRYNRQWRRAPVAVVPVVTGDQFGVALGGAF